MRYTTKVSTILGVIMILASLFIFSTQLTKAAYITGSQSPWSLNGQDVYYSDGNVGVGTTEPTAELHVSGSTGIVKIEGASPRFLLIDTNAKYWQIMANNNDLKFFGNNANTEYVTFQDGGNVGIGTTTPSGSNLVFGSGTGNKIDISGGYIKGLELTPVDNDQAASKYYVDNGSVGWSRLVNFPAACTSGQFVTGLGSTLSCATPAGGGLPSGTVNQTLRYNPSGTVAASSLLTNNGTSINVNYNYTNQCSAIKLGVAGPIMTPSIYLTSPVDGGSCLNISTITDDVGVINFVASTGHYFNKPIRPIDGTVGAPAFTFNNDTDTGIYRSTTNTLDIVTGGSRRLIINSSGNVGIGTSNPMARLEIRTSSAGDELLRLTRSDGTKAWFEDSSGSNAINLKTDSGVVLGIFMANNSFSAPESMIVGRYTSIFNNELSVYGNAAIGQAYEDIEAPSNGLLVEGSVGIGTNSPGSYKLYVNGTFRAANSDIAGNLTVTGNVTANSFIYSSDERLKDNIKTIENPLDKIKALRGVSFDWRQDGRQSLGLIAQEVEKVFPELVSQVGDYKAVEYGNLVAPLIEAVKEQQKQIINLEERLQILENQRK